MVSLRSVSDWIADKRGDLLILMQEGDIGAGFEPNQEWADSVYNAWELLGQALEELSHAEMVG